MSATAPTTLTSRAVRHSSTVDSATRPGIRHARRCGSSTSSSTIGSTTAGMASGSSKSTGQVVAPNRSASVVEPLRRAGPPETACGWVPARWRWPTPSPPAGPGDHRGRHVVTLPTCAVLPARRIIEPMPPDPSFAPTQLAARAAYLLRGNDLGVMTTAAPLLYPHMWSWDAAFVAIGLAPLSVERAVVELDTLLSAQWTNGMIPHIVFANGVDGYFPGPARWATLGAGRQCAAHPAHVGDHPAARARDRGAAHPRSRPHPGPVHARRCRGVPRSPLGRSGALAPLAGRGARPEVARPGHALPRLGVRHGQLAAVG